MPPLDEFMQRLSYGFKNPRLLNLALSHPSAAREDHGQHSNQRLEFLGDAVLALVLSQELYEKFPHIEEGPLTKARAKMVNRRTLAEQARRLDLGPYLRLSRGEELNGGRERASLLADAFEAVVGAIFLDGGFERAREFVLGQFKEVFGELAVIPNLENPKGELQEMLQAQASDPPHYRLASAAGPDHARVFECVVVHHGVELGRGQGKSKKEAEGEAARTALETLRSSAPTPE